MMHVSVSIEKQELIIEVVLQMAVRSLPLQKLYWNLGTAENLHIPELHTLCSLYRQDATPWKNFPLKPHL
jgi:hypothetical protein